MLNATSVYTRQRRWRTGQNVNTTLQKLGHAGFTLAVIMPGVLAAGIMSAAIVAGISCGDTKTQLSRKNLCTPQAVPEKWKGFPCAPSTNSSAAEAHDEN